MERARIEAALLVVRFIRRPGSEIAIFLAGLAIVSLSVFGWQQRVRYEARALAQARVYGEEDRRAKAFADEWLDEALQYWDHPSASHRIAASRMSPKARSDFEKIFWPELPLHSGKRRAAIFLYKEDCPPTGVARARSESGHRFTYYGTLVSLEAIRPWRQLALSVWVEPGPDGFKIVSFDVLGKSGEKGVEEFLQSSLRDTVTTVGQKEVSAYLQARRLAGAGDRRGAIEAYDAVLTENSKFAYGFFVRGFNKCEIEDVDGAFADYGEAIRCSKDFRAAYANRGALRDHRGDFVGALSDYSEAIRLAPCECYLYTNRANAYYGLRQYGLGIQDCERAIAIDPQDARAYSMCAYGWASLSRDCRALELYNKSLELDGMNSWALTARGNVRHSLGDDDGALNDYQRSRSINPRYGWTHTSIGSILSLRGEHARALAYHNRAIALSPEYAYSYSQRGQARMRTGDSAGALKDLEKARRLAPGDGFVWRISGDVYSASGDLDSAMKSYNKAVALAPAEYVSVGRRADCRWLMGDLAGAEADFDAALKKYTGDCNIFLKRARLKAMRGDYPGGFSDILYGAESSLRTLCFKIKSEGIVRGAFYLTLMIQALLIPVVAWVYWSYYMWRAGVASEFGKRG